MSSARNNRRRRKSRGRFGPLFKLLCVVTVVVALTVGATVFFQVETVAVVGNSRYTQEEVAAASGIQVGDNLFHMNKFQVAKQIRETLPYIGEASIQRSLPSTIVITVTEWDAVAKIEAPEMVAPLSAPPETGGEDAPAAADSSGGDSSGDTSGEGDAAQEAAPEVATGPWLISVGGKLLEPAPEGSTAPSVSGLTALMPRAGTPLAVPQEEQARLDALLSLLSGLEQLELLPQVSSIQLDSTRVTLRYLDRFDVKLPLNGDFHYKLQVLEEAVADLNNRIGESCTGTLDLAQEQCQAVYSPE